LLYRCWREAAFPQQPRVERLDHRRADARKRDMPERGKDVQLCPFLIASRSMRADFAQCLTLIDPRSEILFEPKPGRPSGTGHRAIERVMRQLGTEPLRLTPRGEVAEVLPCRTFGRRVNAAVRVHVERTAALLNVGTAHLPPPTEHRVEGQASGARRGGPMEHVSE
jgi:hypothetical protein